jgi:polar amino acid transport system substrate-binding protein
MRIRHRRWLGIGGTALLTLGWAIAAQAQPVLRVGVVEGSQPCSYSEGGAWKGLAVELWTLVAQREDLPYVLRPMPSIRAMLEATRTGRLDVGVECINISPQRLEQYRFSLPFQEDGQAVLVANDPFSLGKAFLAAVVSPSLLRMVGLLVLALLLMSAAVWWVEDHAAQARHSGTGGLHRFIKVFTILLTGEGDCEIVDTSRGRGVLMVGYVVRNVSSAVLVGFLTVELVQEAQGRASRRFDTLDEVATLRVGYKAGTVSEDLLNELGLPLASAASQDAPGRVPLDAISQSLDQLHKGRIDAVLADELQLRYLQSQAAASRVLPVLAIAGIRPELQGFALAPTLPEATVRRIDLAITELKRSGVVQQLRREALSGPGAEAALQSSGF